MSIKILKPEIDEAAYQRAAEIFRNLYYRVTGISLEITESDDGASNLVVIGSDAVSLLLMEEMFEGRLSSLGIRYGTDDYCLHSHKQNGRNILVLAGGQGRSTIYAVYAKAIIGNTAKRRALLAKNY